MSDTDKQGASEPSREPSPSAIAAGANDATLLAGRIAGSRDGSGASDAPEAVNREQDDEASQAHSVTDDAMMRATAVLGADPTDSERAPEGAYEDGHDVPDLVETMGGMVSSGQIDTGAFAGERDDDDEAETLKGW